jgi:hypothetical protein
MITRQDRYLFVQLIRRKIGIQTEEERTREIISRQSRENMQQLAHIFGIDRWQYRLISWWKYWLLHKMGLHQSLLESIHEGTRSNDGRDAVDLLEESRYDRFNYED